MQIKYKLLYGPISDYPINQKLILVEIRTGESIQILYLPIEE